MIHKNYAPGITRVSAAELRGIADLLRTAMRPGLISLTNSALARPYKIGTTTIGVGAFTAGDSIVTGGAVCTAYVTDRIDLASAGDGGGPLPAATYNLYMRVQRAGTASNRVFACYPMVTTGAGAYDVDDAAHPDAFRTGQVNYARPDVYLKLLAGITWDGTEITNSAGFWSALVTEWGQKNIWGALDLTDVGRGTAAAVVIGNGRGLAVDQLLVDTFETNHLSILDGGQIECGDNVDVTFGNNPSIRFTGPVNEIIAEQGGLLFDLGTASEIRLGSGSQITLNAALLAVDETSLVSLSGTLLAVDGSYVIKHAGSDWQLRDQVFTGTPSRYGLYGAQIPRAIAHVEAGGDLAWGFNIDTVERTGEGVYVITLKRPLASTSGFCATAGIYLDGDLRQGAQVTSAASGGGGIAQFTVKTFYLDNPVASVEAVADDARFVFQVLGGELLA